MSGVGVGQNRGWLPRLHLRDPAGGPGGPGGLAHLQVVGRRATANILLVYLLRYVMGEDRITPGMICAGADGQDTCNGDSGGPMVTRHGQTGGYSAIGITSWGQGCAQPDTLGVYTNIAHHLDWVAAQLGYSGVGRGASQP